MGVLEGNNNLSRKHLQQSTYAGAGRRWRWRWLQGLLDGRACDPLSCFLGCLAHVFLSKVGIYLPTYVL